MCHAAENSHSHPIVMKSMYYQVSQSWASVRKNEKMNAEFKLAVHIWGGQFLT